MPKAPVCCCREWNAKLLAVLASLSFFFKFLLPFQDDTGGSHKSLSNSVDSQLKYENDRLKKALAQRYLLLVFLYRNYIT